MLESPDKLKLQSETYEQVKLKIGDVRANLIPFEYRTPHGNQPRIFENRVCIWQSDGQIPWDSPALNDEGIENNMPDGDWAFDGLKVTDLSYIIGYSVGPTKEKETHPWSRYRNVVSSAFVPSHDPDDPDHDKPDFSYEMAWCGNVKAGSTSVYADYKFLDGFNPRGAGSWGGIWKGKSVSYSTPPFSLTPIDSAGSEGTLAFNRVEITRDTPYTIGLYASGFSEEPGALNMHPLACSVTFP